MSKEFNYKNYYSEKERIANKIIDLLNEYNLEECLIREIIALVSERMDYTIPNVKIHIDKYDVKDSD